MGFRADSPVSRLLNRNSINDDDDDERRVSSATTSREKYYDRDEFVCLFLIAKRPDKRFELNPMSGKRNSETYIFWWKIRNSKSVNNMRSAHGHRNVPFSLKILQLISGLYTLVYYGDRFAEGSTAASIRYTYTFT